MSDAEQRSLHGREPAQEPEFERGQTFDRYVLLEKLGQGGMGVVYAAYDPNLDRKVALKLLRVEPSGSTGATDARSRLFREAQAMAKLAHPNVVHVYDVGEVGEQVFIAAQLVEGKTLREWLRERERPWRDVLDQFILAGNGLAAAHSAGLVHRDFKPANVLVGDDGRVRVTDFGLARMTGEAEYSGEVDLANPPTLRDVPEGLLTSPLTMAGTVMGTPKYMSPEQLHGAPLDDKADQFSFCVALYEGLYREHPFAGKERDKDELHKSLAVGKIRPTPRDTKVPGWLRRVVVRGLALYPNERWSSMQALLAALGRDPRRMWRRVGIGAAVAVAVGAGGVTWGQHQKRRGQVCAGAGERLAGVWDAGRKEGVRAAFLATNASYAGDVWPRVETVLDLYTGRWTSTRRSACEATQIRKEQSEALMDLRMACLDRRLQELRGLIKVFNDADPDVVAKAVKAASALTPVERCSDTEALQSGVAPPEDERTAERVAAVRERFAEGNAMYQAGRYGPGLDLAEELVGEAQTLGYEPLIAETLLLLGKLQSRAAKLEEAEANLREAGWTAEAARHDEVAAEAQLLLVFVVGYQGARHEEGLVWARHAQAVIARTGGAKDALQATLESYSAVVYNGLGDTDRAVEHALRGVALAEGAKGPDHPDLSSAQNTVGVAYLTAERYLDARSHFARALQIEEKANGPRHPHVAHVLNNLGVVALDLDDFAGAKEPLERSLAIIREALGSNHPSTAAPLNNLGRVLTEEKDYETALAHIEAARQVWEKTLGADHPSVAEAYDNLAHLHGEANRPQQSLAAAQRGLQIREKVHGEDAPATAYSVARVAEALAALGRDKEALFQGERALRIAEAGSLTQTHARFALAKILRKIGRDPERARELAQAARSHYASTGETTKAELARVDAWLAEAAGRP